MPFTLNEGLADALLDRLATDDAFRTLFQDDPRSALASLGHVAAAESDSTTGIWTCLKVGQLAPKETFVASREVLRKQLLSETAPYNPFNLQG